MGRRKKASKKVSADTAESAAATGGGVRGRKADPVETARRVAVLKRVEGGEISNNQAADELGLKIGTWAVWKSNYLKRQGGGKAKVKAKAAKAAKPAKAAKAPKAKGGDALKAARAAKAAKAAKAASTGAPSLAGLQDLVAHLQGVQEFGQALKAQLQQLADLVERQFPS